MTDADLDDVTGPRAVSGPPIPPKPSLPAEGEVRPLSELRAWGLLWLLNTVVFHPRGFALYLHLDGDGEVTGWGLLGDGREPWRFAGEDEYLDEMYARTVELLAERGLPMPAVPIARPAPPPCPGKGCDIDEHLPKAA